MPHREILLGGSGGGGKSSASLMAALQYVDRPDYAALIFRRTYSDLALPGAIMDRGREWLTGTAAKWNESRKTFTFPSGARVTFAYMENDADRFRYQGAEFQTIIFEELTQFTDRQYTYLFSRMRRSADSTVPIRMRTTSNPGGVGHEWVFRRFFEETKDGRLFVPATLDENPHLDREAYIESLEELDPLTRRQLLLGDWFALPSGTKFQREWFQMADSYQVPAGARTIRYWDLAATEVSKKNKDPDWTASALLAVKDGQYWLKDVRRIRATPANVERFIARTADEDGQGVHIHMEQEPGSAGKNTIDHYARHILSGYTFRGEKTTGSKEERANPVSSAVEAGNFFVLRGSWNRDFFDEICQFPLPGVHDDQVDATSGAFKVLSTGKRIMRWA